VSDTCDQAELSNYEARGTVSAAGIGVFAELLLVGPWGIWF
jgi:hypothetical protein